jgi:predicted permease
MGAAMQNQRQHRMTDVYALVKAGVPLDAARSEVAAISGRLHGAYPKDYSNAMRVTLTPWREVLVKNARPTLLILMAAVVLVLVVACANVGNLSLARLTRREKELAVRAALGASALRLRTELLTEHLALAFAGSALGLGVASVMLKVLVDYTARLTLRADAVELNGVVLVFALVIGTGAAIVFAWVPRLPAADGSGSQLAGAAGGGRSTMGQRQRGIQRILVVLQVGVSFVVLVGAGLLVRTFANLQAIAPGFDPTNVVSLRAPNVTGLNPVRSRAVFDDVTSRLRVYPGVVSVATTSRAPFEPGEIFPVFVKAQGSGLTGSTAPVQMLALTVSPDYFDTLKIRLRRGRLFGPQDAAHGQRVAVINETLARLAFNQADPIGRTIDWNEMEDTWTTPRTIIGVVSDVHEVGGSGTTLPTAYESSVQAPPGTALLVRTAGDPALVAREATAIIRRLDPKRPVLDVTTLQSASADRIAPSRLNATLFSGFAVLALSIAAVGIWGVLAFSVTQRTREFGIRMALGSGRGRILEGVLAEGLTLAGSGLAIGTVGAALMVRQLQAMLFDVAALDLRTFAAVGALLAAVAALASWVPAMRATRVDPNVALRSN